MASSLLYSGLELFPRMHSADAIDRHQDLKQVNATPTWLDGVDGAALLDVIENCFSRVDAAAYLDKYFLADDCFERRLRLFFAGSRLVGYCLLTFRKAPMGKRALILMGASAGFLPAYRHGNNTLRFSLQVAYGYKLRHPWQQLYFADTMLSPAMYRVMAKTVALVYPRADTPTPSDVAALLDLLQPTSTEAGHVVHVGRKSDYSADDLARFAASDKPEIRYYLKANPRFADGYGLLTVMPVNAIQLLLTFFKQFRAA